MPLVSVILATHRTTPFLRAAVDSVRAQTLPDWELVIVDNGANLNDAALGPAGGDPRVKLLRFDRNRGIPAAHNAAVAAAQGEFVALLDHDDVMLPRRLEAQVARLRAEPELGLVSSQAESIDAEGRLLGPEFALVSAADQFRYSQFAMPVVTPAYAGRREVFARFPYREEFSVAADFDFFARAVEVCRSAGVPEVLLQYRHHAGQTTLEQAALVEHQRAGVRLLAARRRAGRAEEIVPALPVAATPSAACAQWADYFHAEGWPVLAAFHARRAAVLRRAPGAILRAAWRGARVLAAAGGSERALAARMFFRGPVRALGVQPA